MSSNYGKNININIFGESHGNAIGVTINGIKAGLYMDLDFINSEINRRKPIEGISTPRKEEDEIEILSGVFNGYTTGAPLTIIVRNKNTISKHYDSTIMRPSHADYTGYVKYDGFNDYRGGGHFSGRITLPIVIAGAICKLLLKKNGINIFSKIKCIGSIVDNNDEITNNDLFKKMKEEILKAREMQDSIGGIIEGYITGVPVGVGEPFFDSVESVLSHLLFSIPAVKGVQFGSGFGFANMLGSKANDEFVYNGEVITTKTNNNGGINGGISNGNTIVTSVCIKPTPSISKIQNTINIETKENVEYSINGRHDPCIVPRALVVVEAMLAIGILDLYLDYLKIKGLNI